MLGWFNSPEVDQQILAEIRAIVQSVEELQQTIFSINANGRIRALNDLESRAGLGALRPLQKFNPGSGLNRAIAVLPISDNVDVVMPQWNPMIDSWDHNEVLRAIEFYNEDFGIKQDYDLIARKTRVRRWFSS
ncbi:hypothetical protein BDN72DRAFT_837411 [Pluteus cervinus]|uniref:Uncharacterized protein n=1 Tax=Pluteus cervinus TaxID=181527 RepID=A0ACD3B117_9AGAR|nr:hypothetical protein BDN72DRAFT_837411 [Pluteus cervinus]